MWHFLLPQQWKDVFVQMHPHHEGQLQHRHFLGPTRPQQWLPRWVCLLLVFPTYFCAISTSLETLKIYLRDWNIWLPFSHLYLMGYIPFKPGLLFTGNLWENCKQQHGYGICVSDASWWPRKFPPSFLLLNQKNVGLSFCPTENV